MNAFRYQALESGGSTVKGVIEAEDRKEALQLLSKKGLFPSTLEKCSEKATPVTAIENGPGTAPRRFTLGRAIKRKEVTAFTREMGTLLGAGIPIPQALKGLEEQEENPVLRDVVLQIAD